MHGFLPLSKITPTTTEGVAFQKKLLHAVIFHGFAVVISLLLVGVVGVMKQTILMYLAFYSRNTLSMTSTVLYLILLISAGFFGIFELSTFSDEVAGLAVYLMISVI